MKKIALIVILIMVSMTIPTASVFIRSVSAQSAQVTVTPSISTTLGSSFILNISINNVVDLYGWQVSIEYRPIIQINDVTQDTSFFDGSFFGRVNETIIYDITGWTPIATRLTIYSSLLGSVSGVTGSGVVASLNFTAVQTGTTEIMPKPMPILLDSNCNEIEQATVVTHGVMVTGAGKCFLQVDVPLYGSLNTTSGIYDNGTQITIEATETTGVFRWIKVVDAYYYSKTVTITMDKDYIVSAYFQVPTLTIYTNVPGVDVDIGGLKRVVGASKTLAVSLPIGYYLVKASKTGYYDYSRNMWIADNVTVNIQMNPVIFHKYPILLESELIIFRATLTYSNWTKTYMDFDRLIEVEVLPNATGFITLIVHYDTDYPIIEIKAVNISRISFDVVQLYGHYCKESYKAIIGKTYFTGFKIETSTNLLLQISGVPEPLSIWKMKPRETLATKFTDWTWADGNLSLSFEAGDPTFSMLFPSPSGVNPSVLVMLQVALPIIALVGFAMVFIKERPESIEDIVGYVAAFLIIGVIMPLAINMLVSG